MIPALCALVVVAVVVAVKDGVVGMPLADLEGKDTDHVLTMIRTSYKVQNNAILLGLKHNLPIRTLAIIYILFLFIF